VHNSRKSLRHKSFIYIAGIARLCGNKENEDGGGVSKLCGRYNKRARICINIS
jgi:hypothetical protein